MKIGCISFKLKRTSRRRYGEKKKLANKISFSSFPFSFLGAPSIYKAKKENQFKTLPPFFLTS